MGETEAVRDGNNVGVSVDVVDGKSVGCGVRYSFLEVGISDGWPDGSKLGAMVLSLDGLSVGASVGYFVGASVGPPVTNW